MEGTLILIYANAQRDHKQQTPYFIDEWQEMIPTASQLQLHTFWLSLKIGYVKLVS